MEIGDSVLVVKSICPGCGEELDGAVNVGKPGRVRPCVGSASVCMYCGTFCVFSEDFTLQRMNDVTFRSLNTETQIMLRNIQEKVRGSH